MKVQFVNWRYPTTMQGKVVVRLGDTWNTTMEKQIRRVVGLIVGRCFIGLLQTDEGVHSGREAEPTPSRPPGWPMSDDN